MEIIFNIFTRLIEKLKLMFIKTKKSTREDLQQSFYIEILFYTRDLFYQFKVPIIAQLKDENEALSFRHNIVKEIVEQDLIIGDLVLRKLKNNQEIESKKRFIEGSFGDSGYITVEVALSEINYTTTPVSKTLESHKFKANILRGEAAHLQSSEPIFGFIINKSILQD